MNRRNWRTQRKMLVFGRRDFHSRKLCAQVERSFLFDAATNSNDVVQQTRANATPLLFNIYSTYIESLR